MNGDFARLGLQVPEIMLPNPAVDLSKWAVVACDQYTSQPEYWKKVSRVVGDAPSTLHLIFPEVFLGKGGEQERIAQIQQRMRDYVAEGVLKSRGCGLIYLERRFSDAARPAARLRRGLIVALDLECYDYRPGAQTLIRATEGTVLERIPPRVRIREGAPLESPHIMVLIDDPEGRVIEPLSDVKMQFTKAYDTQLMMNGGSVTGYLIQKPDALHNIAQGLAALADPAQFEMKYGVKTRAPLLYAVGDGNHSLATAKAVWEKMKEKAGARGGIDPALSNHPARYALVELVNLHDPGLHFEPIHRVLFQADFTTMTAAMRQYFGATNFTMQRLEETENLGQQMQAARGNNQTHVIGYISGPEKGFFQIRNPRHHLEVGNLQAFIDQYLPSHPQTTVDYIHGEQVVAELGRKPGNVGFYLPAIAKQELFKTVILEGVLPRKTFSMGEAEEKRFYLECRRIMEREEL